MGGGGVSVGSLLVVGLLPPITGTALVLAVYGRSDRADWVAVVCGLGVFIFGNLLGGVVSLTVPLLFIGN
jgi:hypothetical protein